MPRRPARITVHLVETARDHTCSGQPIRDLTVELRQGDTRWSVGRIHGGPGRWEALPIGAGAWTRRHRTRANALHALLLREDFRQPHTFTTDRSAA